MKKKDARRSSIHKERKKERRKSRKEERQRRKSMKNAPPEVINMNRLDNDDVKKKK